MTEFDKAVDRLVDENSSLREAVLHANLENTELKKEVERLRNFANTVMNKWPGWKPNYRFNIDEVVTKVKGSEWSGKVVGFYRTDLTPEGYAVESEFHSGSVQIYPASALMVKKT